MEKRWWRIKVLCGAGLIGCVGLAYILRPGSVALPALPGQMLAVAGGSCTLFHAWLLQTNTQGDSQGDRPGNLVTRGGLFPYLRHPMYAGDALLYAGLALLAPSISSLFLLLLSWFALYKQSQAEDKWLQSLFGERFTQWQQQTW